MDFDFTPEQEQFRKAVREFAEEVVAPRCEEMDKAERYARNGQHERIEKPTEKKSIVRPKPVRKY